MQEYGLIATTPEQRSEERYPCVGIALIYSPLQNDNVAGFGSALLQASLADMSLRGLSFDVEVPLKPGRRLVLLVEQPAGGAHERLLSKVRWCEQLGVDRYRIGVSIAAATGGDNDRPGEHLSFPIGIGPAIPVGMELPCPACGRHTTFRLIGQQTVNRSSAMMPLYDCGVCGSTRSITSVLAHSRQQAMLATIEQCALDHLHNQPKEFS